MSPKMVKSLEIGQDLEFQKKAWVVQRVGWVIFAVLLVVAMLGVFGEGPLSTQIAGQEGDVVWAEFDRFGRMQSQRELRVHVSPEALVDGKAEVFVDADYLRNFQVKGIIPTASASRQVPGGYVYEFEAENLENEMVVSFYLTPNTYGIYDGIVGVNGGEQVTFSQLIYP